ncbi:MAG: ribonuclease P protein component [Dehalococcoidia bacterium]|nr:ribonuclease P protein component [Dehalococcoidia bacterium]
MPPRRGEERLRRRQDFVAVLRRGRRTRHRLLRLSARPNGLQHSRYGFAVGRAVGNAVARNRAKRRLREVMRRLPLAAGYDVVVTAEPASAAASFCELVDAVKACTERMDLIAQ